MIRIGVGGASSYDVVVGHGLAGTATDDLAGALAGAVRCGVVVAAELAHLAEPVVEAISNLGIEVCVCDLPPGEAAKDVATMSSLWSDFGRFNLTRSDVVVGVGGGAATDVAGFAAATWLRGVRWVAVPTTLLGMVDAAVGGKTAINTETGKNLVGAFHPPALVMVDLDVLDTLPRSEWINGMAEVVKAGFIADKGILDLVESDPTGASTPTGPHSEELIERAIRVKADVVTQDLHETGVRESLNYGHTLGHAIELRERYLWPHGHAVSVGLLYAAELGRLSGRLSSDDVSRHEQILQAIGLPTTYEPAAWPELLASMRHDKKARGNLLRFVVLDGFGAPTILDGPDESMLAEAYERIAR